MEHGHGSLKFNIRDPDSFCFIRRILHRRLPCCTCTRVRQVTGRGSARRTSCPRRVLHLLFHLAGRVRPRAVVRMNAKSKLSTYTVTLTHPVKRYVAVRRDSPLSPRPSPLASRHGCLRVATGGNSRVTLFSRALARGKTIRLLRITRASRCQRIMDVTLPRMGSGALFIVRNVRRDRSGHT